MYRVLVAALVVSTSLVSAGCADDRGSGSDAGDGVDAGGPPPGTDGGTGGTDAGVDAGAVRSCFPECASAADCAATETGAFSADNYTCVDARCAYVGCHSDAECQETWGVTGDTYRCDTSETIPVCYPVCGSAADCAATETGAFSPDNYECAGGHCVYLGCASDAECQETYPGAPYRCDSTLEVPSCYPVCASAADCAATEAGAFSADNYECSSGHCVYLGCTSDAECQETWPTSTDTYRCR
ncbi:MAG: hypothetical protein R3B82_10105 [Sandaracinaceae bacterium]